MSPYSIPLCTIFTKCPAPSGPQCVTHGPESSARGDRFEHVADALPRFARAARHERRTEARAVFAAGDAGADEVQVALAQRASRRLRVLEPRVAAVDDDVAVVEQRQQLVEHLVDRRAGLDHHHDPARPFERADELFERRRAGELLSRVVGDEGCVFSASRFQTATVKPCSSMLSARFAPITPRPIMPNCEVTLSPRRSSPPVRAARGLPRRFRRGRC
jgi:hypothetical protein